MLDSEPPAAAPEMPSPAVLLPPFEINTQHNKECLLDFDTNDAPSKGLLAGTETAQRRKGTCSPPTATRARACRVIAVKV